MNKVILTAVICAVAIFGAFFGCTNDIVNNALDKNRNNTNNGTDPNNPNKTGEVKDYTQNSNLGGTWYHIVESTPHTIYKMYFESVNNYNWRMSEASGTMNNIEWLKLASGSEYLMTGKGVLRDFQAAVDWVRGSDFHSNSDDGVNLPLGYVCPAVVSAPDGDIGSFITQNAVIKITVPLNGIDVGFDLGKVMSGKWQRAAPTEAEYQVYASLVR